MKNSSPLKNRIIKSSSANVLGIVARIGNQLLIVPILLAYWSPELFGEWLMITAIPTFLALTDFGFIDAGSNELAKRSSESSPKEVQDFFNRYSVCFQRWSLFIALIICIAAFLLPLDKMMGLKLISSTDASYIIIFLSLSVVVSQNNLSLLAGLRVQGKFHIGLLVRTGLSISQIFVTWCLVSLLKCSPIEVALSYFVLTILAYVLQWTVLRHSGLQQTINPFLTLPAGESMKPYFLIGLEMMLMPLAQALTLQGSVILVGKTLGPVIAAMYVTHRTLSRTSSSLLQVFAIPLRAEAGLLQKKADSELLTATTNLLSSVTFWLSLLLSMVLMLIGGWIFEIWTHGEIVFYKELLIFLLLAVIAESLWRIPTSIRLGSNRHRPVAWGYLLFSILGLLLSYLLAPYYGLIGVVTGLVFIDVMMVVLAILTLRGIINIPIGKFLLNVVKPPIKEIKVLINRTFKKLVKG
ncbi:lipopolysaccharide biosynthesis protein [Alteromonas oceani]|uniref:Lipopolysaccharide biosynthesis protein n=1 Tax=Alteromonas oceani TaxID=2071609 RepID=A0ABV7JU39_9ALTE|nr:hypothetical protein [Alteromonas oceani]